MKVKLIRYFGNDAVTKSLLVVDAAGERFECEARETQFRSYTEPFAGSRTFCLPEGRLMGRIRSTLVSPLTLCIGRTLRSCCTLVAYDEKRESKAGYILVGKADKSISPEERCLHSQKETFETLSDLLRKAYAKGESVDVEVCHFDNAST